MLEAIYGAYAIDWLDQGERIRESLADEARWLAVLARELLETEPEAWGLAALLTFAQSRAPARAATRGRRSTSRIPRLWDAALIAEGRALLRRASALGRPLGRFQLEAAIQAVHCDRARTGELDADTSSRCTADWSRSRRPRARARPSPPPRRACDAADRRVA